MLINNIKRLIKSLKLVRDKYAFDLEGYAVLPDHIHALIKPENIKDYPKIISSFKAHFSRMTDVLEIEDIRNHLTESKINKREKGVWQRCYWEHTICDQDELNAYLDYIHYNPVNTTTLLK